MREKRQKTALFEQASKQLLLRISKRNATFTELVTGTSLPMSDRIDLIPFARRSPMVVYVRLEG